MSVHTATRRLTAPDIRARKGGEPVVCLTSYHAHTAALMNDHVDLILVGDSLGMVLHGLESTVGVTLDMMIVHGRAVVRGARRPLVVVDLPFGTYEENPSQTFQSAARVMRETGCGAVKLEGGQRMADTIHFLSERGVPVMAHIGLTPQSVNTMGGFKTQGRQRAEWKALETDAKAVTDAGAFSIVLEGMAEPLAARITKQIAIPTIGIGASAACDGQILVLEDMLGLNPRPAKFVKEYAQMAAYISDAVAAYAADVKTRAFPGAEHTYAMKPVAKRKT